MREQVLNIEQMDNLIKLGFDDSKASMALYYPADMLDNISVETPRFLGEEEYCCPTFTLQDLITLIPDEIFCNGICYDLVINKDGFKYCKDSKDIHEFCNILHIECDDNLTISAYNMIVWLTENKYINMNK